MLIAIYGLIGFGIGYLCVLIFQPILVAISNRHLTPDQLKEKKRDRAIDIFTRRYATQDVVYRNISYIKSIGDKYPHSQLLFHGDNSRLAIRIINPAFIVYDDDKIYANWRHTPIMYRYQLLCCPDDDVSDVADDILSGTGTKFEHFKSWAEILYKEYDQLVDDIHISADPDVDDDDKKFHI